MWPQGVLQQDQTAINVYTPKLGLHCITVTFSFFQIFLWRDAVLMIYYHLLTMLIELHWMLRKACFHLCMRIPVLVSTLVMWVFFFCMGVNKQHIKVKHYVVSLSCLWLSGKEKKRRKPELGQGILKGKCPRNQWSVLKLILTHKGGVQPGKDC